MSRTFRFAAAMLAGCCAVPAEAQHVVELAGVVTQAGTPLQFAVNGTAVTCAPDRTTTAVDNGKTKQSEKGCTQLTLGAKVTVAGEKDTSGVLHALSVVVQMPQTFDAKGNAIVEAVLPTPPSMAAAVQADGYTLVIPSDAVLHYAPGMATATSAIVPDTWISYSGVLQQDGTVRVRSADVRANLIDKGETRLRNKQEFDAAAVTDQDQQGRLSRFFKGQDVKRFPAYHDAALQSRVERIGATLVPAYQRNMPVDSPTRVDVRFQVVKTAIAPMGLASGIVLVSYEDLKYLSTDAQIAAVLATGLADALDKNALAWERLQMKNAYASAAGAVANLFTFGTAGIATSLTEHGHDNAVRRRALQHDLRESLQWMHNAGYDLAEAPTAWWSITAEGRPLAEVRMPEESAYLYQLLDTVWQRDTTGPSPSQNH